ASMVGRGQAHEHEQARRKRRARPFRVREELRVGESSFSRFRVPLSCVQQSEVVGVAVRVRVESGQIMGQNGEGGSVGNPVEGGQTSLGEGRGQTSVKVGLTQVNQVPVEEGVGIGGRRGCYLVHTAQLHGR